MLPVQPDQLSLSADDFNSAFSLPQPFIYIYARSCDQICCAVFECAQLQNAAYKYIYYSKIEHAMRVFARIS